jgi:precorrin-4/cobalt-precorrin-4 C11-methyltransferase
MKVYFVGAGPGSKELLTLKAYQLLKKADLIIYPGSIIEEKMLKEFSGHKVNSHGMTLEEIVELIEEAVKRNKNVVRLQSGDPSIYGAIQEQIDLLEKRGIEVEVVPGVSSIFASAAALKSELTLPGVSQTVVITRPSGKTLDQDQITELSQMDTTLVILLGVHKIREVVKKVERPGNTPVAVVYHASREDEKIIRGTLKDIADKVEREGIDRTAVIIIGNVLKSGYGRSVLYSK